jgi:hypothetical protein
MLNFFYSQILLYLSFLIILFIPGYFLLLVIFGKNESPISKLERFILSFGLSFSIVNFIAFLYSKSNISITAFSSILGIIIFSLVCFAFYFIFKKKNVENLSPEKLFNFSKNQFFLILTLLILSIFIRTAYLSGTVAPTSTDMGHHMYWVKEMVEKNKLPVYEGMPDFIIGEHIVIGKMAMINKMSVFSAFPVIFLFLINIIGILTVFILTLRIFKNKNIAIFSLIFLGVIFAVSSPQAKFISGGVMGNILGNFLIPLAFYFYFRAFENIGNLESEFHLNKKNGQKFLSLAILTTFTLFYTHHLSAFIFIFIFALLIPFFLLVNYKNISKIFKEGLGYFFSFPVIITLLTGLIFFFFIFTPNYIETNAVETAVGAPSKATREGLSFNTLKSSVGESRMALGLIGLFLLILSYKKNNFGFAIIFSWTIAILIMSTKPNLLFINLPSSRIGNYLSYPLAILCAYGLYSIFNLKTINIKNLNLKINLNNLILEKFNRSIFIIIFIFVLASGLIDTSRAFKSSPDFSPLIETFEASKYLLEKNEKEDVILKDHNYVVGDSWMKLFFMQGYKYPQSRGYFKRYFDPTKPREMCTLHMISTPVGEEALECFSETKTNYLVVNPLYDGSQFKKLKNFDSVYQSEGVAIYYRK